MIETSELNPEQVMINHIKRPLQPGEEITHANGNKNDNRIENLELLYYGKRLGQRQEDRIAWALSYIKKFGRRCGYIVKECPTEDISIVETPHGQVFGFYHRYCSYKDCTEEGKFKNIGETLQMKKFRKNGIDIGEEDRTIWNTGDSPPIDGKKEDKLMWALLFTQSLIESGDALILEPWNSSDPMPEGAQFLAVK